MDLFMDWTGWDSKQLWPQQLYTDNKCHQSYNCFSNPLIAKQAKPQYLHVELNEKLSEGASPQS